MKVYVSHKAYVGYLVVTIYLAYKYLHNTTDSTGGTILKSLGQAAVVIRQ